MPTSSKTITGALPPSSRCTRLSVSAAVRATCLPVVDRAGQRDHVDVGVLEQRLPGRLAGARDHVQHALRAGSSAASSARRTVVIGVVSAGFSTTVLPAASAGRDLPDRHHQRVVPGRDLADHADRLAAHEGGVALHVLAGGAALQAARGAGEEAQVVGHHGDLVARDRRRSACRRSAPPGARSPRRAPRSRRRAPSSACARSRGRRLRPALERARARRCTARSTSCGGRDRRARDLLAGGGVEHRLRSRRRRRPTRRR